MTVARRRGDERLVVQWVGEDLGAGVVEVLLADRDDAGGDAPGVLQGMPTWSAMSASRRG
jgi:hypothetical protein